MRIALLPISLVWLLAACATYRPKPIVPAETAASIERRTLTSPGFKRFLEKNLRREILPWPPETWDLTMLTLAAFYYHPDLDVARAQWAIAKAGVITAGARPNPSLGLDLEFVSNAVKGLSPWILGFVLDTPVETAGKRGHRVDRAQQVSTAARLRMAAAAWRVRSRVRDRLLRLCVIAQAGSLLSKRQSAQAEILRVLERELELGEVSQPIVTRAHISLEQTRLSLAQKRGEEAQMRVQLAQALGLSADALREIAFSFAAFAQPPSIANLSEPEARQKALLNRVDVLVALQNYAASEAALALEVARQYPDIHLGPGYTFDQGDNKWTIAPGISLPVLNRNRGPIAEAEAHRTEAEARFLSTQSTVLGEVDRAFVACRAALEQLATADSLVEAHRRRLSVEEALYHAGEANRLTMLEAQLELIVSMQARLEALDRSQQGIGQLEDALQQPLVSPGFSRALVESNPRKREEK